jgi:hypothetical protein
MFLRRSTSRNREFSSDARQEAVPSTARAAESARIQILLARRLYQSIMDIY